ncbi:doublecortin domain-containing protein 2C [Arapaima gigas]
MAGPSARASVPQPPATKTLAMYRNGDPFFPARKVVVNPRHMATFDSFLSAATRAVEAPFGAVRNVYTPRQGHRIVSLEQLQHGQGYVAAGAEHFKHLDYYKITAMKPQRKPSELIQPVVHSRIVASSRWRKPANESCAINVFTNGDILVPPARVLIPKYTLKKWESVLALITQKVRLRTGAVHRLCTLDGTPLLGSIELENHQYYVAVGAERFRFLPYFQCIPKRRISGDKPNGQVHHGLPPAGKSKHTHHMLPDRRGPLSAEDPEDGEPPPPPQRKPSSSPFYAGPQPAKAQRRVSKLLHFLPTGEGSIFVAKDRRKETMGAREVQEDGRTKVDLPVDQVKVEVLSSAAVVLVKYVMTAHALRVKVTGGACPLSLPTMLRRQQGPARRSLAPGSQVLDVAEVREVKGPPRRQQMSPAWRDLLGTGLAFAGVTGSVPPSRPPPMERRSSGLIPSDEIKQAMRLSEKRAPRGMGAGGGLLGVAGGGVKAGFVPWGWGAGVKGCRKPLDTPRWACFETPADTCPTCLIPLPLLTSCIPEQRRE